MMKKIIGLLLLLVLMSPASYAQSQLVRGAVQTGRGVKAVRSAAEISKELAVLPAVERAFQRSLLAPVVTHPEVVTPQPGFAAAVQLALYPTNRVLTQKVVNRPLASIPYIKRIFQARPNGADPGPNKFSGTIVQVSYQGKKEIYGVIAAHTITSHVGERALGRLFTADIFVGERFISVPAEVVQVSAPNTLDLALVKFPAEVEAQLEPFEINPSEPNIGDIFQTQGFTHNSPVFLPDRTLMSENALYLRVEMELSPFERRGLCGAPVIEQGLLTGIHIGSTYGKAREPSYIGYATRAKFINTLVAAYHHDTAADIPFELAGQKIMNLKADEYISYVRLTASDESVVWYKMLESKFPSRTVEALINSFSPRYIDFVVSRVSWENNMLPEPDGLIGDQDPWYRYDLFTKQVRLRQRN